MPPALDAIGDSDDWTLSISGESCEKPTEFTVAELKQRFEHHTYALTLECGGNGRNEDLDPRLFGNKLSAGQNQSSGQSSTQRLAATLQGQGS